MKPKILAVKYGYNPNSSSIGVALNVFIYQSLFINVLFASLGFLLAFKKKKPAGESES
jgi:hypothetical protein